MELETERLRLRLWRGSDFKHFESYFSDPELSKYVGGIKGKEQAWRLMAAYIGHWQLKGYGKMAVEEKESKQFVGCAGLWNSDNWPELELGYWFVREGQGKGYATEAALRMKIFAFDELKADTLVSYIHPENEASKKLALRLGAIEENSIDLIGFGEHCVFRYPKV